MRHSAKDIPLEALRGIAATIVVLWHAMLGFFPNRAGIFPGIDATQAASAKPWFGLIHGPAAVTFFFVLSGYVLTRKYLVAGDSAILVRSAVKRWPRLAGPTTAAVLISWSLFALGLYRFEEAAHITGSPWLARFGYAFDQPFLPSLWDALAQGAFYTFFRGDAFYDSSLWTMRYEFIGSFVAFGLALLVYPLRHEKPWVAAALIMVALLICHYVSPLYAAFPIGLALAAFIPAERAALPVSAMLLMLGGAVYFWGYTGSEVGAFAPVAKLAPRGTPPAYLHVLGSVLVILAAESSPLLRKALSGRWAALLGELSFPLYLVHILVLCSLGSAVMVLTNPNVPAPLPNVIAAVVTVAGSFLAAVPLAVLNRWWVGLVNTRVSRILMPNHVSRAGPGATFPSRA
jgi:peptidoglycan/LPS O-acetylase OafA/YrhL